jgi:hypothetical protein
VEGSFQISSEYEIIESYFQKGLVNILSVNYRQSNKASSKLSATLSYTTITTEKEYIAGLIVEQP